MLPSLFNLQLTHKPFNKVRGIFFLKDCVPRRLYCVVVITLHAYVDVDVLCVCIVGHGYCMTIQHSAHSLREFYSSIQNQSVYSTASANWAIITSSN